MGSSDPEDPVGNESQTVTAQMQVKLVIKIMVAIYEQLWSNVT